MMRACSVRYDPGISAKSTWRRELRNIMETADEPG